MLAHRMHCIVLSCTCSAFVLPQRPKRRPGRQLGPSSFSSLSLSPDFLPFRSSALLSHKHSLVGSQFASTSVHTMPFYDPYYFPSYPPGPSRLPGHPSSVPFPFSLLPSRLHVHPLVRKLSPHLALRAYTWRAPERPIRPAYQNLAPGLGPRTAQGRKSLDVPMGPQAGRLGRFNDRPDPYIGRDAYGPGAYPDPQSYYYFPPSSGSGPPFVTPSYAGRRPRAHSLPTRYMSSLEGTYGSSFPTDTRGTTGRYDYGYGYGSGLSSNLQSLAPREARTEYVKAGLPGYTPPSTPMPGQAFPYGSNEVTFSVLLSACLCGRRLCVPPRAVICSQPYRWSDPGIYGYEPLSDGPWTYRSPTIRYPRSGCYDEAYPRTYRPDASRAGLGAPDMPLSETYEPFRRSTTYGDPFRSTRSCLPRHPATRSYRTRIDDDGLGFFPAGYDVSPHDSISQRAGPSLPSPGPDPYARRDGLASGTGRERYVTGMYDRLTGSRGGGRHGGGRRW